MTYELRTYTATPGKMGALLARFRDHTVGIFSRHGMESVGYWVAVEDPDVLVYLLRHVGDGEQNWTRFRADPEWIDAKARSVADGEIVADIASVFLEPTDFSALG